MIELKLSDFESDSLYWMDSKYFAIFRRSLNLDDTRIDNVFSSYSYLRQPLFIDFFEVSLM